LPLQKNIPIFNRAGATFGKDFAIRKVNYLFMLTLDLNQFDKILYQYKSKKNYKREKNRLILYLDSYVVCRPTYKEAEEYLHYY